MREQDERGPGGVPKPPTGGGTAKRTGYGAGGLGAGGDRALGRDVSDYDAPGVTPAGKRTGSLSPDRPDAGEAVQTSKDQPPARE